MTTLADACRPRELAAEGFALYEVFRPAVPEGVKGWGAKGVLDLRKINARERRTRTRPALKLQNASIGGLPRSALQGGKGRSPGAHQSLSRRKTLLKGPLNCR